MYDLSVVIPAFCTTPVSLSWLEEAIISSITRDSEVVLVDDGSPIEVFPLAKKYHLRYVAIPHSGVSTARNAGVAYSRTELVIPLDGDDRFAEGAIRKLLDIFDGNTPVYPDVKKFGLEDFPHYVLLDFDCQHIYNHVGFSSVNVLHRKDQWKSIGGWNPNIDFYEDGEYNARLFANYCGMRLPEPLVEYRIHEHQRTKTYKERSALYARKIMEMIRRLDMPCKSCGGARKAFTSTAVPTQTVTTAIDVNSLPGEQEGLVLAQYIGGEGKGKHYYRGPVTQNPYRVVYGDYLYVDPRDACLPTVDGITLFIRIVKQEQSQPVQQISNQPVSQETVLRSARTDVQRVSMQATESSIVDLPEIATMSVKEIYNMDAIPVDVAKRLLVLERNGKNRANVIAHLERFANAK